jgi:hypothetical protein
MLWIQRKSNQGHKRYIQGQTEGKLFLNEQNMEGKRNTQNNQNSFYICKTNIRPDSFKFIKTHTEQTARKIGNVKFRQDRTLIKIPVDPLTILDDKNLPDHKKYTLFEIVILTTVIAIALCLLSYILNILLKKYSKCPYHKNDKNRKDETYIEIKPKRFEDKWKNFITTLPNQFNEKEKTNDTKSDE